MKYIVGFKQEIEADTPEQAAELAVQSMVELENPSLLIMEVSEVDEEDIEGDFAVYVVEDGEGYALVDRRNKT